MAQAPSTQAFLLLVLLVGTYFVQECKADLLGGLGGLLLCPILGVVSILNALQGIGGLVGLGAPAPFQRVTSTTRNTYNAELVYIWTGDDDHKDPDFISIFNFNRSSPNYGKLINTVPLTGCSAKANEPHHLTFSTDYKRVAGAGILSFLPLAGALPNQDQVFFFDTTDPTNPKQISTANPVISGAADELYPVKETGGFLLSSLSTKGGTAFGTITEFDRNGVATGTYPNLIPLAGVDPEDLDGIQGTGVLGSGGILLPSITSLVDAGGIVSLDTLNIHGIAVREDLDIMVTTDFIEPASALDATQINLVYSGLRYQPTYRLWKYSTRTIIGTWEVDQHAGNLVTHYIPHDTYGRFYGTGVHANKIYLLDPDLSGGFKNLKWETALAFNDWGLPNADPHYFILGDDSKTGFVTLNAVDRVVKFDFSNRHVIKIVDVYILPVGSNPHYIAFYPGGLGGTQSKYDNRFVLVNYFLDFTGFGIIKRGGTKTVQVFQWNTTNLYPDPKWKTLDFKTLFASTTGAARPHGTTYYYGPSLYNY